ncbi:MAG TPA: glutaredoxin family protein [Vicinamibacteria bacterium]
MTPVEIELFTRPGCHLCEEMKAALVDAACGLEIRLREIDISEDPDLEARYGNDIPVLFVNGSKAFEHRATVEELRKRLRQAS